MEKQSEVSERAQHTPGPWMAVNDTLVRGPHGEAVASTVGFAFPVDVKHGANARLIAEAPALLAACEGLCQVAQELAECHRPEYVAAWSAIARATGKDGDK